MNAGFYMVINTAKMFTLCSLLYEENQYHVHSCTFRTKDPHQRPSTLTSDHVNKPWTSCDFILSKQPSHKKKLIQMKEDENMFKNRKEQGKK